MSFGAIVFVCLLVSSHGLDQPLSSRPEEDVAVLPEDLRLGSTFDLYHGLTPLAFSSTRGQFTVPSGEIPQFQMTRQQVESLQAQASSSSEFDSIASYLGIVPIRSNSLGSDGSEGPVSVYSLCNPVQFMYTLPVESEEFSDESVSQCATLRDEASAEIGPGEGPSRPRTMYHSLKGSNWAGTLPNSEITFSDNIDSLLVVAENLDSILETAECALLKEDENEIQFSERLRKVYTILVKMHVRAFQARSSLAAVGQGDPVLGCDGVLLSLNIIQEEVDLILSQWGPPIPNSVIYFRMLVEPIQDLLSAFDPLRCLPLVESTIL